MPAAVPSPNLSDQDAGRVLAMAGPLIIQARSGELTKDGVDRTLALTRKHFLHHRRGMGLLVVLDANAAIPSPEARERQLEGLKVVGEDANFRCAVAVAERA